ncbi:FecR domain-containing protein [Usitatibacter palustris]|uniref:Uncharacterized protein n=1 Tax=Usitatibacter palustris TaxID=2732487 RepID=A0A6M4H1U7_9PROT|nr:FecR domain-containing protein [Usitatibacter palustris]QJR13302.1 hypothetical protein DSM104440_00085 [Usitatibacter palustris]
MDARRRNLSKVIAAAMLLPGGLSAWMSRALAAGTVGGMQGVARLEGTATVNGTAAQVGTPVKAGDKVVTGKGSQAVVVIGDDAFLMRSDTVIEFKGRGSVLSELAIASGKVLNVFSKKPMAIKAATASIGIRGTGAYIEVEPKKVYFCLCYGTADIDGPNMTTKTVVTTHHESPLYLLDDGRALSAEPGPFLNHKDDELILLESLCGREPPFVKSGQYPSKKY